MSTEEEIDSSKQIVTMPDDESGADDDDEKSSTTSSTITTATASPNQNPTIQIKNKNHNVRSQSLQSSSACSTSTIVSESSSSSLSTTSSTVLTHQLKAQSTMNITEKHVQKLITCASGTTTISTNPSISTTILNPIAKGKFMSFLQNPEFASTSSATTLSHGNQYLTAQQKHVRQFVRSTSAHSSTDSTSGNISIAGKSERCIRSSSHQTDDGIEHGPTLETHSKSFQHSSSILISKSAEAIEAMKNSAPMRTQLTLSGGFLAPPNRKLTILSPIHAPPGLQDLLRKHRSPLSPRINFPGSDAELFP